jgi:CubicO group peptidase (beta-lactamase class C family)
LTGRNEGRLGFFFLGLFAFVPVAAWGQGFPPDEAVREILEDRVALGRNPGIIAGLVDEAGARFVAAGSSGVDGVPLDDQTVFEIGSISKVFTATILEDMADRGEVRFDDPVATFLPGHVRVPKEGSREITLLHLAIHRSGLPRMPLNFAPADLRNPYADYTVEQLYAFLSSYELQRSIGAVWDYSNLGMGLLGHALSLRTGRTYEQLVRERILDPLEMDHTGIDLAPPSGTPTAQGHDGEVKPTNFWDVPTLTGAGGLRSTTSDMLRFAEANLEESVVPITRILQLTHEVRVPHVDIGLSMALGWLVNRGFPDRSILWHNGGTGGFHSFIGLDKERRRAVVILTNGVQSIDDIGFHLLDQRNPLSPPDPFGEQKPAKE